MNICGTRLCGVHPGWGTIADELLFYSSRYQPYVRRELGRMAGVMDCPRWQAEDWTLGQRAALAQLLREPPNRESVRRVLAWLAEPRPVSPRPHFAAVPARPRRSTGLGNVHPLEPLFALAHRLRLRVRIRGRTVELEPAAYQRLMSGSYGRVQENLLEALRLAARAGYRVRNSGAAVSRLAG